MIGQPGGDKAAWRQVLAHRPHDERNEVAERFAESGVALEEVKAALDDGGDALYAAARSGDREWAERFGGPLAVALLAVEVSALMAHLNSRSSAVRTLAVDALLDEVSAVTVAVRLGVSRQKVYDISRTKPIRPFVDQTPWREP